MITVTLDSVSKLFGSVRAVDDVSLVIEKGELFFLLGPSGCGKTTLLRMIAGFYTPEQGAIRFGDRDVTHVPPHKRRTGMVFQNYALWPHMTVRDNLAFGLEMQKVPERDRAARLEEALETVQMTAYADRYPNQLSGGQQQRVALGRALVIRPDVVLLDEPLSNLDARLRIEMREQITSIHRGLGLTMIYVTHDQGEALSMADRIAVMHEGQVIQIGPPKAIYRRPATRFVADFIGETNLISGTVESVGDVIVIATAVGRLQAATIGSPVAVGERALCSIRPEAIGFRPGDDTISFKATLRNNAFLGSYEQFFFELPDGAGLQATESDTDDLHFERGDEVALYVSPQDVVLLPDDGAR